MKRLILAILVIGMALLGACASPPETKPFPPPEGYQSWEEYNKKYESQTTSSQPTPIIPSLILEPTTVTGPPPSHTQPTTNTPTTNPSTTPTPTIFSFKLNTSVEPSGAGSVIPSGGMYEKGTVLTLTATPSSTYEYGDWRDTLGLTHTKHAVFDHWSGDASGSSTSITVVMDSAKSVIAHFSIVPIPPIEITAVELANEYIQNVATAESKYRDRTVRVTGKITSVSTKTNVSTTGFVMLDVPAGEQFGGVMCEYAYPSKMESLVVGQTVIIQGIVSVYSMNTILLLNCSLVE